MLFRTSILLFIGLLVSRSSWADEPAERDIETTERRVEHWAFHQPKRPPLPELRGKTWHASAIDAFVLARLEVDGLRPSPDADRATLLRRLSLDLTGLPPTREEMDRFLADASPDACERLIDRLMASPHFGERWGRHWLDLARYADSDGYTLDSPRPWAWRWRDWVIEAINADMSFDQFTVEQLAGDLLPDATTEQNVATGFHRNTLRNAEGGVDREEYRVRAVVDRVNTTGTVWLGLTVGCAQCHDHKYDPVSQREYYRLFAFFNNDEEVQMPAPLPHELEDYERQRASFDAKTFEAGNDRLRAAIADEVGRLPSKTTAWEKTVRPPPTEWTVLRPKTFGATGTQTKMELLPDGSILVGGPNNFFNNFSLAYDTDLEGITALRLEALSDPSQPASGPGRDPEGNFLLSEFRVAVRSHQGGDEESDPAPTDFDPIAFDRAVADHEESGHSIRTSLDGDTGTGWAIRPASGRHHTAVFLSEVPFGVAGGSTLNVGLDHHEHTIGRFRLLATTTRLEVEEGNLSVSEALPYPIVEILRKDAAERTDADSKRLHQFVETIDPELVRLRKELVAREHRRPQPPQTKARALVLRGDRKTHVHVRGDFLRKGAEVVPGTPAVLPALETTSAEAPNRLQLARWIVDGEHPLSSRVFANRLWQRLFGKGLVATPDDLGTRGEPPTHRLLLDWLAREAVREEWSRKALIRRILTSRTYRQSSRHRPDLAERDPDNRLLARQNRQRLEAEIIRDMGLAVSGLMTWTIGGPSIRPPLPGEVGDIGFANLVPWTVSNGEDRYRRGLYIFARRTVPYPMLTTFDAPESTVTCTRRETSNTPIHALFLLNDAVFLEFARGLARRVIDAAPRSAEARLRQVYRLCLAREPGVQRLASLRRFHAELQTEFSGDTAAAKELAGISTTDSAVDGRVTELAVWTAIARVVMNTDRYLTRE